MKLWINIPDLKNEIKDLNYSEYLLGWFTFIHKNWAISIGKKKRFMVFLTLEEMFHIISEIEKNPEHEKEIILEDHGDVFKLKLKNNTIVIINKEYKFSANFIELKKALKEGTIKFFKKIKRINPQITNSEYFNRLEELALQLDK